MEVYTEVHHVLEVPVGATLVLVPRPEDADWLNINRPVFAQRELKVVLFCDKDTSIALARQAVDFFDWISHRVECPEDPPPFAVAGIRCALAARAPGIVWRGGGLESTFAAARPRRVLHQVSVAQPYQALVAEIRAHRRKWIAWTGVDSQFRLRRVRWALAEAGHRTRTFLVEPDVTPPDWWPVHARVVQPGLARARLKTASSFPFPGRLSALTGLEPEALERVSELLRQGTPWTELQARLLEAPTRELARRPETAAPTQAMDAAEAVLWKHVFHKGVPWVELSEQALLAGDTEVADVWAQHALDANLPDGTLGLARVRHAQGRYSEAEQLLRQSLRADGTPQHMLARVYERQGKYSEAERVLRECLALREQDLGREHPEYAASLHLLGRVLEKQGKFPEAEQFLRQALAIRERALGWEHPDHGASLHLLSRVLASQEKNSEAEALLRQSLAILEQALGKEHPEYAASLHTLARVFLRQRRYSEAEGLLHQALTLRERAPGKEHPDYAASLHLLARVLLKQGRYSEAEALFRQALAIREQVHGRQHPDYQASLRLLASTLEQQGRYAEAESVWRQ